MQNLLDLNPCTDYNGVAAWKVFHSFPSFVGVIITQVGEAVLKSPMISVAVVGSVWQRSRCLLCGELEMKKILIFFLLGSCG